jgi:hypothetical protein
MPDATTRETIAILARNAGLDLPEVYLDQLVAAYADVRRMVANIPYGQARGDEPAQVFNPTAYLPGKA